jgi:hypothetical protein
VHALCWWYATIVMLFLKGRTETTITSNNFGISLMSLQRPVQVMIQIVGFMTLTLTYISDYSLILRVHVNHSFTQEVYVHVIFDHVVLK